MRKTMMGRRHFMKSTLAGFGGFFFLASNEKKQEEKVIDIKGKEQKFVYRTLGKTGLKLPVINMGVMNSDIPILSGGPGLRHLASGYSSCLYARTKRGSDWNGHQGATQRFFLHRQQSKSSSGSHNGSLHRRGNDRGIYKKLDISLSVWG